MRRSLTLLLGLACISSDLRADDGIPPDTVVAVKHATVFIRVQGANWKASGSGFVVAAEKDSVLVATNYHVIASSENEKKRLPPGELLKSVKAVNISAVLDSGTKTELALKAQVVAADQENDLAILRVSGLKALPAPIAYANPPKLTETMPVYTFGYPLGEVLATGKGAPAITVGKGSVSSLRNGEDGELKLVQIDASLNPGNSGGPVVDTKGRLVGIVVSGYRNAQGLNFAIPASELGKLMKGRVDGFHVSATKSADGKLKLRADVGLLDPTSAIRGVTLHYVIVPPKGTKPNEKEPLAKHASMKKTTLKVEGGLATCELTLDATEGDLYVQAVPDGSTSGASRVCSYSLALPKSAVGAVALGPVGGIPEGSGAGEVPPPAGWKEYIAKNKTFKLWLPEKTTRQSERERTTGRPPGTRLRFNSIVVELPNGTTYLVEQIIMTPPPRLANRNEIMKLLRDIAIGDGPGARVTREVDARMGRFAGKEYLIERRSSATRARAFVIGSSIYLLRVVGTTAQVDSTDSTLFLESCRLQVRTPPAGQRGPIAGGGPNDPVFKDLVPPKGQLVGLELGIGVIGQFTPIRAIRPVFLVDNKETFGRWHGSNDAKVIKNTVKLVAKPGYAIGAMKVRVSTWVWKLSVTYMKVANGKLDPKESYESEWVGTKEPPDPGPITFGGKGDVMQGLIGKTNGDRLVGVGLLYQGVELKVPDPKAPNGSTAGNLPTKSGDRGPRIQGGGQEEFRDAAPASGVLVGLEVGMGKWFNTPVIKAIRPIYRVGEKDSFGEQYGTAPDGTMKAIAKPGYAVGAIRVKSGGGLDAVSLVFMKLKDGKLDPKDSYESDWLGGPGGFTPVRIGGDGTLVVGVLLKGNSKEINGIGLIYSDTNKPGLDGAWPRGIPSKIQGGGADREFREAGGDKALLVGMEVGVGRFFNNPVIRSVRPVFRAGDKESMGEWHGPTDKKAVSEVVKVVAKPGYAVGAITAKTGLGMDGFSVTFMKVVDGKLDPKDSYESDWVGGKGGGGPVKIGDGNPVIGLIGKARADTLSGLGLLHPAPAKK